MLSKRFNVPVEICDSGIVEIVMKEQANLNCRVKPIGEGETLYWCRAVGDDGETFGGTFAVGSDELAKWKEVQPGVIARANKLLESYRKNSTCDRCDLSVGFVCDECTLVQMICDLRNELVR